MGVPRGFGWGWGGGVEHVGANKRLGESLGAVFGCVKGFDGFDSGRRVDGGEFSQLNAGSVDVFRVGGGDASSSIERLIVLN
ncbi:hypothetical protein Kpho01_37120 [Kitasatospora phosalacinea]|uniref:Uncharacterized protein n=1 Tax=Kitasatospora phosalacinea TaxID=2065 RepID=A0A9W6PIF9_9ACTN|nr:hypothetical protein Kpho01_37120 [Kitasatospora phosalacinea]